MKTFQASSPKILGLKYSRPRSPTKWILISSSRAEESHHDVLFSRLEAYMFQSLMKVSEELLQRSPFFKDENNLVTYGLKEKLALPAEEVTKGVTRTQVY
jgi:hypothetical protein